MNEKMNPEIKAQWLTALRSGEYRQAQGALRRESDDVSVGFCCLGVLCDVLAKDGRIDFTDALDYPDLRNYGAGKDSEGDSFEGSSFSLPYVVREMVGFSTDCGEYEDENGHARSLIALNDTLGHSFAQIADVIEKHF